MTNNVIRYAKVRATEQAILAEAKDIDLCQFGHSVIALNKDIRLVQQKASEKAFEAQFKVPFSEVKKVTYIQNFRRYEEAKKIESMTGNTLNPEKQTGAHRLDGYKSVRVTDKDGSLMLQCSYQLDDTSKFETRYIVSGKRFATDEESAFIEAHKYIAPASKKQAEAGVQHGEEIRFLQFKFSNIIAVGHNQLVQPIWESFTK